MKILNARLRGFIGIEKGLGLDEIGLDLSGLSGLIALQGDNGKGKTTLLENLQPFRTLPSRKGTLKSHCYLTDSEKELSFEFHGDHYRTLVKMNALTTTRDEGFIWKNEVSMVDGLVTNYDQYLLDLLGSQNLFFASIFCAQNSDKLSDLRPAQLKSLFAEFLRLDRYVAWEETGKAAAGIYSRKISELQERIERTDTKIKMLGDPRADHKAAQKVEATLQLDLVDFEMRIEAGNKRLEELKKIVLDSHINREKKVALTTESDRLQKVITEFETNFDEMMGESKKKSDDLSKEAKEAEKTVENKEEIERAVIVLNTANEVISQLDDNIYFLNLDITETNELLKNERERAASVGKKIYDLKLDTRIPGFTTELDTVNREMTEVTNKLSNIHLDPELVKIETEIRAMEKSAAVLDDIDPACTSEVCGLITLSIDDKKNLPSTNVRYGEVETTLVEMLTDKARNLKDQVLELTKKVEAVSLEISEEATDLNKLHGEINKAITLIEMRTTKLSKDLEDANKKRRGFQEQSVELKPMADQAPLITIAAARLKDLNITINNIKTHTASLELKHLADIKSLSEKLISTSDEIARVGNLIDEDADALQEKVDFGVRTMTTQKEAITADIIKNAATLEAIKKELNQILIMEEEVRVIQERKKIYLSTQSSWTYIHNACSKDGLRALEIEGVAPVITTHANDMLTGTFGPNHTVRLKTLDEDGREILDIIVISGDGSEALLSNMSGGESVWILKSLRLAQTLISQQKSGRHFETSLMDEEDGALSNANAIKFIALYGTLMKMAKMSSCYFISHRPDAINMADHQLKFKEGGISIL